MSLPTNANVQSLDAIKDIRLALIRFQEQASTTLGSLRTRIDRTQAWLEQDRPLYWSEQERRAYDGVASARVAYDTCRLRTVGGRHPECIEEKVALQRARSRLEYCQQQMELVRRIVVDVGQQIDDYRGRSGLLQRRLEEDVPKVLAMLGRMIEAIEAYASVGAAETDAAAGQTSIAAEAEQPAMDEQTRIDSGEETNLDVEGESENKASA